MPGCSGGNGPAGDVVNNSEPESAANDSPAISEESDAVTSPALRDLDGNSVSLSDFLGEVVVLNF